MCRLLALAVVVVGPSVCVAADLAALPANTWAPLKPEIVQPAAADEQGQWVNAG